MRRYVQLNLMILCVVIASAAAASDSIIIKKDSRLDVLTAKQVLANKRSAMLTGSGQYKGYRIQVLSTANRNAAFDMKAMLLTNFPDQKTYVLYQSPSFKVRIGNFLKKEEAENFRKQMAGLFPNGVYIVEDAIDYTPADDEDIILQ